MDPPKQPAEEGSRAAAALPQTQHHIAAATGVPAEESLLATLRRTLFTAEDTFNVHKVLGFAVLAHILVRLACIPFATSSKDLMGFGFGRPEVPVCVALHAVLSLSSLIFHIPARRIKDGTRIWPEFRLHSIVFTHRALANMLVVWADQLYPAPSGPRYWANVLVLYASLAGADLASASVPPETTSRTISGFQTSGASKAFFSFMQFLAGARALLGLRSYDGYFTGVVLLQTTAFSFTLQRKNLLSHGVTIAIYLGQLLLLLGVYFTETGAWAGVDGICLVIALGAAAMTLRIPLGLSKYAVWAVVTIVIQYARATTAVVPPAERVPVPWWAWPAAAAVASGVLAAAMSAHNARRARQQVASAGAAGSPEQKQQQHEE